MDHSEGWLSGSDGLELYYQRWGTPSQGRAAVSIVHGLGSHSGWFANIVRPLVAHDYVVYALDLRGHGRSAGQRGYINRWSEFRSDFHQLRQLVETTHPELPHFALGHSLGALVVLDYVLATPGALAGLIAIAPAIAEVGVSPLRLTIGKVLSRVWPRFTLDTGLSGDAGSKDTTIADDYANDPLRHSLGTARLATEFLSTRDQIQAHLPQLTTPTLILHGGADTVTLPESGRTAFARLPEGDKTYREYPNAYHDLHNDTCAEDVTQDILSWLGCRDQVKQVA